MSTDVIGEAREEREEAPTSELVSAAVGSRCSNCEAPMASDQRYCLNCGARRGKPRFQAGSALAATAAPTTPAHSRDRPRMSSAATLVAGVATLLIAMGVGVLIGHYSANNTPQRASAPIVLRVGSGGSTTANLAPAQQTTPTRAGRFHAPKKVIVHLTPKLVQKASAAASKVFGSGGNLSKNITQSVGGSCGGGSGCQNGKFTGNFFSGG